MIRTANDPGAIAAREHIREDAAEFEADQPGDGADAIEANGAAE